MNILEIIESAQSAARAFLSGKTQSEAREQIARAVDSAWASLFIGEGVPPAQAQYTPFLAAFGLVVATQLPTLPA